MLSSEYSPGFSAGFVLGGGDVGVDPVDVVLHVFDGLQAGGAVLLRQRVELFLQVGFGVGGEAPLRGVGAGVGAAEEGGEFGAAGVAQDIHQEEAVGGAGVAGAEHRVGAGFAVDVGHAVGGVALDRHARFRFDRRGHFARRHAEGRVLEVGRDFFVGQFGEP